MLHAVLLLAASSTPPAPTREAVTAMAVRVQVSHICNVSPQGLHCRGAAGQPPVRVLTTPSGVTIVEF